MYPSEVGKVAGSRTEFCNNFICNFDSRFPREAVYGARFIMSHEEYIYYVNNKMVILM